MKSFFSVLFGACALSLLFFFTESSSFRGMILSTPTEQSLEEKIHAFCDTSPQNGILTLREMRQGLLRIIQGVTIGDRSMDFSGDGAINRVDLVQAISAFRFLLGCGNGVLSTAEQCDDGNVHGEDGCSAVCRAEQGYTCINSPSPSVCTNTSRVMCSLPQVTDVSFLSDSTTAQIIKPLDGYTGTQSLLFRSFALTTDDVLENGRSVMLGGYTSQDTKSATGLGYQTHEAILDQYGTVLYSVPLNEHVYDIALASLIGSARKDIVAAFFGGTSLGTTVAVIDLDTGLRTTLFTLPSLPSHLSFAIADVDRDSDIDIVLTQTSTTSAGETLWMENESGTWRKHSLLARGADDVAVALLSPDGLPDILLQSGTQRELLRQVQSCVTPIVRPPSTVSSVRIANLTSTNADSVAFLGQRHLLEWMSNETLSEDLRGANIAFALEYSLDHGVTWKHFFYQAFGGLSFPQNATRLATVWVAGQQGERATDTILFRVSAVDQSSVPATIDRFMRHPAIRLLPVSATSNELQILPDCGNGLIDANESCDNDIATSFPTTSSDRGGHIPPKKGDGCSDSCTIETGYTCTGTIGTQSVCRASQ